MSIGSRNPRDPWHPAAGMRSAKEEKVSENLRCEFNLGCSKRGADTDMRGMPYTRKGPVGATRRVSQVQPIHEA
ncbi:hypothetical protein FOPE_04168 [Fonsecaea pedrosoi]|nr:hypothetical protein FOPE_04168 [Fonsecaea pedrosoi]